jgi:hypothetical protein
MEEFQRETQHGDLMGIHPNVVVGRSVDARLCSSEAGRTTHFQFGIEFVLCKFYTVVQSISKSS